MADQSPFQGSRNGTGNDNRVRPNRETPPGTPRWVKVFGVFALVFVLLFVVLHLTGSSPFGHMHMEHGVHQP